MIGVGGPLVLSATHFLTGKLVTVRIRSTGKGKDKEREEDQMEENVKIVSSAYDAIEFKHVEALLDLLDLEIEVSQTPLLPWGGTFGGHQGFIRYAARMLEHIDSQPEFEELVSSGDQVVAIGRTRGRVKANGRQFHLRFVHVWTVKDGKIVRFEPYINAPEMLQALGG